MRGNNLINRDGIDSGTLIVSSNLFDIDRTQCIPLSDPCAGIFGNDRWFSIDGERCFRVVHHRMIIVGKVQRIRQIQRILIEVVFSTCVSQKA